MPDKNEIQTSIAVIQSQMDTFAKNQTYLMGQVSSIKDLLQQELSSIRTEFNNNIKEHAKENELRLKELHLQMDDKLKAQKELLTKEIEGKAPKSEFNTIYKLVWGVVTLIVFGVANELFNLV